MAAPVLHFGEPLGSAGAACVLVHGRGQTPEEMVDQVIAQIDAPGVAWLLPRAEGKSWYKARAVDPLTAQTRAELDAALDVVSGALEAGRGPGVPLILAGFSQGACVALEWLFRRSGRVDGCAALTGARLGVAGEDRPLGSLSGLPVLLTGSDDDPWIPVPAFAEAVTDLGRARARLRAELYPGRAHAVSAAECAALADMLAQAAAGRPAMEAA